MTDITTELQPTAGQEAAIVTLLDWAKKQPIADDDRFAALKGSAGTGKTTVLSFFLQRHGKPWQVCAAAPTHKACAEIAKRTGLQAFTIQKLLGMRPDVELAEYDINNPKFSQQVADELSNYAIALVDESSMITRDLFLMIKNTALRANCLVLFIGDELQLPPVNEAVPAALNEVKLVINLEEIIRQKDTNPLQTPLMLMRDDIRGRLHRAIPHMVATGVDINDKEEGYAMIPTREAYTKLVKENFLKAKEEDKLTDIKLLAYTNNSVSSWTKYIRDILNPESSKPIDDGDLLMSYRSIVNEFGQTLLMNSQEYIVVSSDYGKNEYDINGYYLSLKLAHNGIHLGQPMFVVDFEDEANFIEIWRTFYHATRDTTNKRVAWENYWKFKNTNLLLRNIKLGSGPNGFTVYKDIDFGYGITVHKSQGATYDQTFINGNDLNRNFDYDERRKLWYVATSRTSRKCTIFLQA